ncbi:hypothetical protein Taro_012866 [Colocasia esculenta]|uniref:CLAVATA3/ESR (CLE)-related protein 9 n=1 Tax=Colocasia esculenta TaxID=4460 RepID=A0A843UDY8_COLES|nr:hypothetical protein [Colocasia esculenta]
MKVPLSREEYGLRALALAAILLSAVILAHLAEASPQAEPSATLRRCHRHAHHRLARNRPYPAALRPGPPSWCIHFARNPHRQPLPPPPPPSAEEMDPLYGEVKRLVPSGPNPLHN